MQLVWDGTVKWLYPSDTTSTFLFGYTFTCVSMFDMFSSGHIIVSCIYYPARNTETVMLYPDCSGARHRGTWPRPWPDSSPVHIIGQTGFWRVLFAGQCCFLLSVCIITVLLIFFNWFSQVSICFEISSKTLSHCHKVYLIVHFLVHVDLLDIWKLLTWSELHWTFVGLVWLVIYPDL